jgi:pyruvate dehydrogenase E1 component alpha subunit
MGLLTEKKISNILSKINAEIESAIKFAEDSPHPDVSDLLEDVYCEG